MKNKKTITVIGSISSSPFILNDVKLLQKYYNVKTIDIAGKLSKTTFDRITQYISIGITMIFDVIPKTITSDIVYIWFADVHAFLPVLLCKILNKQSVIAIGGYEVSNIPSINYGMLREPINWRGRVCRWVIKNTYKCIVPSISYYNKTLPYVTDETKMYIAPDCVEASPMIDYNKHNMVLMVAQADENRYLLKGIPYYNDVAGKMKNIPFYLIGNYDESIKLEYNNIIYLGSLPHNTVLDYMSLSKVYCQLSKTESFGVSVLESMMMGCVPVVTNADNLPNIVGMDGIIVFDKYPETIESGIRTALKRSSYPIHKSISNNAIAKSKVYCKMREHAFRDIFEVP